MLLLRRTCSKRFSHPKEPKEAEGTGGAPRQQGAHSAFPSSLLTWSARGQQQKKGLEPEPFNPNPAWLKSSKIFLSEKLIKVFWDRKQCNALHDIIIKSPD